MSHGTRRLTGAVRIIATAIASVALVLALAPPASAHTSLDATSPADGSQIGAAPTQLELQFATPILTVGYRIVVLGPDGHEYQTGTPQITDNKLTQPLKPLGPTGDYKTEIRIVAIDGHPNTFTTQFTLTKPGPAAGGTKATAPPAPLAPIATDTAKNAPPWAPWTALATTIILASAAVLFGRRATHDLN